MPTRTIATLTVILALAILPGAPRLAAQQLAAPAPPGTTNEFYAPSLTPAVYLINLLFLYIASPDIAGYLPAYKATIPQALVDCLEQNPAGCPYADYRQYFDGTLPVTNTTGLCLWPDLCRLKPQWQHLTPRPFRRADQLNIGIGRRRARQLAHLLGIRNSMILTPAEYQCLIGTPETRTPDQQIIFRCIYNMTNSKGNAVIPLSSYGLNVNDQGEIHSVCATNSPCLKINALLEGPIQQIAYDCGFLGKILRMQAETPFVQLLIAANQCQSSAGAPCLVQTTCTGQ